MLLMASFQLLPGIFLILRHHVASRFSKPKASDLALFFIFGAETAFVFFFLSFYAILNALSFLSPFFASTVFLYALAGVMLALSILSFCFYYRRSPGSKLFISRRRVSQYHIRIKNIKSRSDAFSLGFVSPVFEFIFTFPLFILASFEIMQLGETPVSRAALTILFVLSAILPLVILHFLFGTSHNLSDLLKFRFKNKSFFRFLIALLYFLIAILIIIGASI